MAVFGWRGALWDVTAAETGNHSANGQEECGMSRPAEAQVALFKKVQGTENRAVFQGLARSRKVSCPDQAGREGWGREEK